MSISLYRLHGIMQAIAFLVLFPLGSMFAMFRHRLGPWWLKAHLISQSAATLLVFIAIALVVIAHKKQPHGDDKANVKWETKAHKILGPIIVTLIILQWVWAIVVRGNIEWDVWYKVHTVLAFFIVSLGVVQVYLGYRMTKN